VAEEVNATLIVLGSHGRSAVQEMLAGSTLENVIRLDAARLTPSDEPPESEADGAWLIAPIRKSLAASNATCPRAKSWS
jgi:hypothetical protein